ncbi:MAG: glycosyltransferase family 4 protein, partial [Anaerolineae bacterium]|nr:glycosyltransferase family 4 protein [Anaerolineae bacterium]
LDAPNFQEVIVPLHYTHPWTVFGMPRLLAKYRTDVLFSPFFYATPFFRGSTVLTVHDLMWVLDPWLLARKNNLVDLVKIVAHRVFVPASIRRAKGILVPSMTTANELTQHYGVASEKIKITPLGLDHLTFPDRVRPLNQRENALLFLGSSKPYKNMSGAIDGLAAYLRRHPESRLEVRIVGRSDGFAPRVRKKVRELGLKDRVIFLGQVPDAELKHQLGIVRALLFPSMHEGFGFPPLEAMGYGTPVISSMRASLGEFLNGKVIPIQPDSADSIADGIEALEDQDRVRQLVADGLIHCRGFQWNETAARTLALLKSCAST